MKNKILLVIILLCISNLSILAQKKVRTSGSAQTEWLRTMSRVEAEEKAQQMATIDALERAFGRVIVQGNATYVSNQVTGEKVESNTTFNMIANTSVKGEVVEVLDVKFADIKGYKTVDGKKQEVTEVKCDITVMAKEIVEAPVDFECYPLSCRNKNCKTEMFQNNSDIFMYFNSPMSGYISIYLDLAGETQRLLPYEGMPEVYESGFPVKADKEYILFSNTPEHDYKKEGEYYQTLEYFVSAEKEIDLNRFFVVFSKVPINKPKLDADNQRIKDIHITEADLIKGITLPPSLSSEDFQKWLNKNRSYRKEDMQVAIIDITIRK